ncbi:hypothetical protein F4821DRAFT_262862 [Hypoxylon rubiginosum]|uniref:Uncharacterized protein n=1 Tax=Hypoxylon rubiginosum TaxID=110542 RepID=A0ACC0CSV5_9PEZI|nr:hypothetical protein F4821DRAFT_262862 [Hypoxylon rubiginosum]
MMISKQDYPDLLPEGFDLDNPFDPQLQSQLHPLPQTIQPYGLSMDAYTNNFQQFNNGIYPSPPTPDYPVDHGMFPTVPYSAGPYSAGSTFSGSTVYTPQDRTFDCAENGAINQPMPFTPSGATPYSSMGFGGPFPDTPDTSPTLQQQGGKGHLTTATINKLCEVDNISSPDDTPLIKRRTRARETCNNCRKEHRACDSKKPRCTRCEMYSKGNCCYDRVPKRRGRKPRPTKPLPDHILGAVIRSNPQLEYMIINELQNGIQPDTDVSNCEYLEQDAVRPGLMDFFKSSALYKLVYGDDDAKAEVSASATIFGAHLDSTTPSHQNHSQHQLQLEHDDEYELPI